MVKNTIKVLKCLLLGLIFFTIIQYDLDLHLFSRLSTFKILSTFQIFEFQTATSLKPLNQSKILCATDAVIGFMGVL